MGSRTPSCGRCISGGSVLRLFSGGSLLRQALSNPGLPTRVTVTSAQGRYDSDSDSEILSPAHWQGDFHVGPHARVSPYPGHGLALLVHAPGGLEASRSKGC